MLLSDKFGICCCTALSEPALFAPVMCCGVGVQVQAPGLSLEVPRHGLGHCHSDPLTGVVHDDTLYCIITCQRNSHFVLISVYPATVVFANRQLMVAHVGYPVTFTAAQLHIM